MSDFRNAPRKSTRQKGTAIIGRKTEIACTIRDVSATGARLSFQNPTILPRTFRLRFDEHDQPVTLRWRSGLFAGVRFTSPVATRGDRTRRRSWLW